MDKYTEFCIKEAKYHLNRANELLSGDPKEQYDETREFYKVMAYVFPFMVLLQQCNESQPPDSEMGESLSDTQSSIQSDSDSYAPASLSDH